MTITVKNKRTTNSQSRRTPSALCLFLKHINHVLFFFYFVSVQDDFKAHSSVEQERSSPEAPLKGIDSLISASAAVDNVGGSDMSSEEGEGEGEGDWD